LGESENIKEGGHQAYQNEVAGPIIFKTARVVCRLAEMEKTRSTECADSG